MSTPPAPTREPLAARGERQNSARWLLFVLLLALALRVVNLGTKSMWLDEAFSVRVAGETQSAIWTVVYDTHTPGYYSLLQLWARGGSGDFWLRLPSAIAGVINTALLYALGVILVDRRFALRAAALIAVSPLAIWYAQEARMYIFIAALGTLYMLGLAVNRWWGVFLALPALALGLYVDYPMIPLWLIISGVWLVWWRETGRRPAGPVTWLLSALGAGLLYLPWLDRFLALVERLSRIFVFAQLRGAVGLPELGAAPFLFGLPIIGFAAAAGAWLAVRLWQRHPFARVLVPVVVVAFALITLLMPIPRLYSVKRLLVTGWPLVIILVMAALWGTARRESYWRVLFSVSLAAAVVLAFVPKDDWRGAVGHVVAEIALDEAVIVDPVWNRDPYARYAGENGPELVTLSEIQDGRPVPAGVWLIAERFPGQEPPTSATEQRLNAEWTLQASVPFYRLEVRHYRRR